MPESEVPDFLSIESELTRLLEQLNTLKLEAQEYKSAAQQLSNAREALTDIGKQISDQGDKLTLAGDQVVAALNGAVQALKPLGTGEIRADLQSMKSHLGETTENIVNRVKDVQSAATQIADSAAATMSMAGKITATVNDALTDHRSEFTKLLTDADDNSTRRDEGLASIIKGIDKRLEEVEQKSHAQTKELLDAIEHSSPVRPFRKKRSQ